MRALLFLSFITLPSAPIAAHGGGLNAQGCHNNRKTGDYHCHGGRWPQGRSGKVQPRSKRPVFVDGQRDVCKLRRSERCRCRAGPPR